MDEATERASVWASPRPQHAGENTVPHVRKSSQVDADSVAMKEGDDNCLKCMLIGKSLSQLFTWNHSSYTMVLYSIIILCFQYYIFIFSVTWVMLHIRLFNFLLLFNIFLDSLRYNLHIWGVSNTESNFITQTVSLCSSVAKPPFNSWLKKPLNYFLSL